MNYWSLFVSILCFSGWYYQVHLTTRSYFEYETVTHVKIATVSEFVPPATSLCYYFEYIVDTVNIQKVTGFNFTSCLSNKSAIECYGWLYRHSMDLVMNNFTLNLEDRISNVVFEGQVPLSYSLTTYYCQHKKCVRVSFGPSP